MAKNFIRGFYPEFKLAECCEDGAFRPVLNFLFVKGRYIYATDGRIAVRANMEVVSNLNDEEIALLDEKLIPSKTFKKLQSATAIEITDDGIVVKDDYCKTIHFVFDTKESSELGYNYPNVEGIFQQSIGKVYRNERVGLSTGRLARLAKAMNVTNSDGFALNFTGETGAILVRHANDNNEDICGIIMPIALD